MNGLSGGIVYALSDPTVETSIRRMEPSSVDVSWPLPWGSARLPPSPSPMYRNPSGPNARWPPLWLAKGCGTSRTITSLAGSPAMGPALPTEKRDTTERLGEEAE